MTVDEYTLDAALSQVCTDHSRLINRIEHNILTKSLTYTASFLSAGLVLFCS